MKNLPRRNAALAAATSVIVLGGMALAVPALAASANKAHQNAVVSASAKAAKHTTSASKRAAVAAPSPTSTNNPAPGFPSGDKHRGFGGPGHGFAPYEDVTSVLADLVTKGTLTQEQSTAITDALDAAEAAEHAGETMPDGWHGTSELPAVLTTLVTKGSLTQAQVDAINAGLDAKRAAAQAAEDKFRSQADAIIAGVLGITVEQLQSDRQNHVRPQLTQAQKAEIKTKLDALRTSLGLPIPRHGMGPGHGPGMGPGHGPGIGDGDGDGETADGQGMGPGHGPGMGQGRGDGMRGHGHHGHRGFGQPTPNPSSTSSGTNG